MLVGYWLGWFMQNDCCILVFPTKKFLFILLVMSDTGDSVQARISTVLACKTTNIRLWFGEKHTHQGLCAFYNVYDLICNYVLQKMMEGHLDVLYLLLYRYKLYLTTCFVFFGYRTSF